MYKKKYLTPVITWIREALHKSVWTKAKGNLWLLAYWKELQKWDFDVFCFGILQDTRS